MIKLLICVTASVFITINVRAQLEDHYPSSQLFILGETHNFHSTELNEMRTLNVYLPSGYTAEDANRYPVIYLLDGSADEDFIHVSGLVQFMNFSWINILPPSIVVGIANIDRKRDFTYPTTIQKDLVDFPTTGGSEKFIRFIQNEVQPFIDQQYKTNSDRTLIGQSLGGLLATEILYKHTALFSNYFIISPSLWWDNESLLNMSLQIPKSTTVYIAVGKEGKVMERDSKQLYKLVKKQLGSNAQFEYFGKENHATIYHQALYCGFQKLSTLKH